MPGDRVVNAAVRGANLRGRAWVAAFEAIDPTGADDHFFHLKNNGRRSLEIAEIDLLTTVAGALEIHRASGVATTPTVITPIPLGKTRELPQVTIESGVDLVLTLG